MEKIKAHLHSLNGQFAEVELLGKAKLFGHEISNQYIFKVKNNLCTGIYNCFTGGYYVDDLYGIIDENNENYRTYKNYLGR